MNAGLTEWLKVPVLKTGGAKVSLGSNPRACVYNYK